MSGEKIFDDAKKAYLDEVKEKEHFADANQKLQLKCKIAENKLVANRKENEKLQKLIEEYKVKNKALEVENTQLKDAKIELSDSNGKLAMENKLLQEEIARWKTDKTQLAFCLNEKERNIKLVEEEKQKSMQVISSLTCEKNSLIEKVTSLEKTVSNNMQQLEKLKNQKSNTNRNDGYLTRKRASDEETKRFQEEIKKTKKRQWCVVCLKKGILSLLDCQIYIKP